MQTSSVQDELHKNWLEERGLEEQEEHAAMLRQLDAIEKVCRLLPCAAHAVPAEVQLCQLAA